MQNNRIKLGCIKLYKELPKDEDGFVILDEDYYIHLTCEMYNRCSDRTIIAVRVNEEGGLELFEEFEREDQYTTPNIYEESEEDIYKEVFHAFMNLEKENQ